jgi:hypothetical protein
MMSTKTFVIPRAGMAATGAACLAFLGCAAILGKGGDYQAAYKNKDRATLEQACADYVAKPHGNADKQAACGKLAELNRDELVAARDGGDTALLDQICKGEVVRDASASGIPFDRQGSRVNTAYAVADPDPELEQALVGAGAVRFSAKHVACKFAGGLASQGAAGELDSLLAACGDGQAIVDAFGGLRLDGQARVERMREVADKLAACGDWDTVMVKLVHRDKGMPAALAAAGHDVEQAFVAFLQRTRSAPLSFEYGEHMIDAMVAWLDGGKRHGHCDLFTELYPAMPGSVQSGVIIYLARASCTRAAPLIAPNLAHDAPAYRAQACGALGMLGAKKYQGQIERLSKTDPTYRVDGIHKDYWVRAECARAANKLAAR